MRKILWLVALALLLLAAACGRGEEKPEKSRSGTTRAAGQAQPRTREASQAELASRLQELERRVKQFEAAADKTPPAVRARLHQLLDVLTPKMQAARRSVEELKHAEHENWRQLAASAQAAISQANVAYRQVRRAGDRVLLEQKRAYQQQVQGQLAEKGRQVTSLNERVKNLPAKARARLYPDLDRLQQEMTRARKKFRALKAAGPQHWQDLAPGMEAALQGLQKAYLAAQSHYQRVAPSKRKQQ